MEVGSIWGHGSYVAPDWTADWIHREAVFILDRWAHSDFSNDFDKLTNEPQAQLIARLTKLLHTNTYDPATGTITVDPIRVQAFRVQPRPLHGRLLSREYGLRNSCGSSLRP